jgi:tetratricopeptide (TPR) repeat protein
VICTPEGDVHVLAALQSLIEKSLLRQEEGVESEPRLSMLETIREYACERLAASRETEELQRRHAVYFLALAEEAEPELFGPEQGIWLARLEAEHANLRAVLRWASSSGEVEFGLRLAGVLGWFWELGGYLSEGRGWLEDILARSGAATGAARAKVLRRTGGLAWDQSDYGRATALYEEALALFRDLGDRRGVAEALNGLGRVAWAQADSERAQTLHEEAPLLFRNLTVKQGIGTVLIDLATVAGGQGRYERAQTLLVEALALYRELADQHGSAIALNRLGQVAAVREDFGRAQTLHREALVLCQQVGAKADIAECLVDLAGVACAQGQPKRAVQLGAAAAALRASIGAPLSPYEQAAFEHNMDAARAALGATAFDTLWASAQVVPYEEIVAEVLTS